MPSLRLLKSKISSVLSRFGHQSYTKAQVPDSPCSDNEWNWDDAELTQSLVSIDIHEVAHNDALSDYAHIEDKMGHSWIRRIRPLHQLETVKSPSSNRAPTNKHLNRIRELKFVKLISSRVSRVKECWRRRASPSTTWDTEKRDNFQILLEEEE